jgi:glycerol-3-phosphate dehydrogenase
VINATGAWVDDTLRKLHIDDRKLIAGTKGTHLFTWNRQLADLLGGRGIYFEADDRRLIFLLPLVGGTFIGTTDLRFEGDPATARAEPHEIEYLLAAANELLSGISLSLDDVDWHCCGVRPLPHVQPSPVSGLQSPASITRRHWLHEHPNTEVPFWSVIGGKLTTCRSLAEETVEIVLARWDRVPNVTSRERPIPDTVDDCHAWKSPDGTRDATFVHQVIETEWATTLGDLVERRLMLLYDPGVTRDDLKFLAGRLVDAEKLDKCQMDSAVENCERRLKEHFGLTLKSS